jgi:hypothetical protein
MTSTIITTTPSTTDIDLPSATVPSDAASPASPATAEQAFLSKKAEILAHVDAGMAKNVDVPRAVSHALAAHTRIEPFFDDIAEALPHHPIQYSRNLDLYAMAAWYAHLEALPKPSSSLEELKAEATTLRFDLVMAARALAHAGKINPATLAVIEKGSGDLDKANDLVALSAALSQAWSTIQNMTAIQWSQVERAATLGPELIVALGQRTGFSSTPTEAKLVRAKAVSLFLTAVDQTERALTYLRWTEDDVRAYLPSPYSGGRSGARSAPRADDLVDPTTDAPATDDDVADVTPAPAGGGSTGGGSSTPA